MLAFSYSSYHVCFSNIYVKYMSGILQFLKSLTNLSIAFLCYDATEDTLLMSLVLRSVRDGWRAQFDEWRQQPCWDKFVTIVAFILT